MSQIFRSRLEKDFEFFVRTLPSLEPIEFWGLAKILCVPTVNEVDLKAFNKEDYEKMEAEEQIEYVAQFNRPINEIVEEVMDKYLALPKRTRKELNQMLKDIKRGK